MTGNSTECRNKKIKKLALVLKKIISQYLDKNRINENDNFWNYKTLEAILKVTCGTPA